MCVRVRPGVRERGNEKSRERARVKSEESEGERNLSKREKRGRHNKRLSFFPFLLILSSSFLFSSVNVLLLVFQQEPK